jgi:hypothetical protein
MNDFERVINIGNTDPRLAKRLPDALRPVVNPSNEIEEAGRQSDDEDSKEAESAIDEMSMALERVAQHKSAPSTARLIQIMSEQSKEMANA